MINGFHMNPLWYLLTLPLIPAFFILRRNIDNAENKKNAILIFEIVTIYLPIILICLSIVLYINNIIGSIDMTSLIIILLLGIGANPLISITIFLNIILIPLAMGLSYTSHK